MFLLPAVDRNPLVEIALRVHEADADQRHAEVAGFLAVIAGQHTQAAGVDRQRLVQRELGGKIGDDLAVERRAVLRPPRALGGARFVEAGDRGVIQRQKLRVLRGLLQTRGIDGEQHPHRVVRRLSPQRVVEAAEDLPCGRRPAPPQIERELVQAMNAAREVERRVRNVPSDCSR